MLNKKLLILGGDTRQLEIIKQLSNKGVTVYLIGFDTLTFYSPYIIQTSEIDFSLIDAILLPVGGTNAVGKVEATYSEEAIYLTKEILEKTPNHCIVYSGTSNQYLDTLVKEHNKELISIFHRNDIAILNSISTAEGALMVAMDNTDFTIHGSHVLVLGFGRVGLTVARLFSSVGANVSVCVRKMEDIARIIEMGLTPIKLADLDENTIGVDICINTIPHLVVNSETLSTMDKSTLIIDIASSPGGTDFEEATNQGLTALHELGLPGKVAPKAAGKIIADILLDLLAENNIK